MCLLTSVGNKFKTQSGGVHRILNGSVLESLLEATGLQFQRPSSGDHLYGLCFLIYLILRWMNKMVCHLGNVRVGGMRNGSLPCASSTPDCCVTQVLVNEVCMGTEADDTKYQVSLLVFSPLLRAPSSLSSLSLLWQAHFHW